jgi:hypothetical protein
MTPVLLTSFGGSIYLKRRLEKDLIFNPKEKTNAQEVFEGRDRR